MAGMSYARLSSAPLVDNAFPILSWRPDPLQNLSVWFLSWNPIAVNMWEVSEPAKSFASDGIYQFR